MSSVWKLLVTQFLTAFADNAILFIAVAMALNSGHESGWYIPAMQSLFLVSFVLLAPWVGRLADTRPKPRVLVWGNLVKLAGASMVLVGGDPLFAYAVVGIGATIYGPAKYGILPELVGEERLVRANGWVEGSTIVAIVLGTMLGAQVADHSVNAALLMVVLAFAASTVAALMLPRQPAEPGPSGPVLPEFARNMRCFLSGPKARFSMLGAGLFWAAAAVLRVMLVAWAPLVLGLHSSSEIAGLTLFLAIGIVIGAALAPRLIPIQGLRRARLAAYGMGTLVFALAAADSLWLSRGLLLGAGVMGGLFVVPVNAALQDLGHRSIGAGNAVAMQNFFENIGMLSGVGLYTVSTLLGASPIPGLMVLGCFILLATLWVSWRLPRDDGRTVPDAGDSSAVLVEEFEGEGR